MQPDTDPAPNANLVEMLAPYLDLPDRIAIAALEQMSWCLFCYYHLFEGLNDEIKGALVGTSGLDLLTEMASGIPDLRISVETALAEISVRHFDQIYSSTAGVIQDELDSAFDPEMIFFPFANVAPQCQKMVGVGIRRCTRLAIYIGSGEWSEGCQTHAPSGDRDRNKQWNHHLDGKPGGEIRLRRSRQVTDVAKALLDWWPTIACPKDAIAAALRESQA